MGRRKGAPPSDGPGTLPAELMLHFLRAATGGQPEGGSRPQTPQKGGLGRGKVKQEEAMLRVRSGAGSRMQPQRRAGWERLLELLRNAHR